ncbi:MAG: argininosuccinate synthase [Theionarchaea archaeon]|nr:argininosuccinate synthase [Theionarchaea archaeon]MBU7001072.1 argininosuccinate synthase [Theionarchaea archaeon]MBU7020561.1 argininosuccinate synthase [Theionarchaea archaeon]MBU7034172.1 argininosuccinate synthase [Theionarchaea archaeon]MBU7039284.1 argininosuccinate synthase [Theionarchaea archaeon]
MNPKVVLAYSGGLDTSVILTWLQDRSYDVIAYIADVGQHEDLAAAEDKALKTGASTVYREDLKRDFVEDYIFTAIKANAIYEGRYLLGTSLARPLIARKQIEIAHKEGAEYVAHGATGKGNDQVRFELTYYALDPDIKVISPWKNQEFLSQITGRSDLLSYALAHNIPISQSETEIYSEDANLMHISHEAGLLEDPLYCPPDTMLKYCKSLKEAPDEETRIEIHFKDGTPIKVVNVEDGTVKTDSLELFQYLNYLGSENGVGVVDMVENRTVGIKSRGVYETPGATILWIAHQDIEGIAMDREVMRLRDMLTPKFSEMVYSGFWFSPEMDFILKAIEKSQEMIDGVVYLSLYKGNVRVMGRESPSSLYDRDLSSMDIEGGFSQKDSEGFINIHAIRLKAHKAILDKHGKTFFD